MKKLCILTMLVIGLIFAGNALATGGGYQPEPQCPGKCTPVLPYIPTGSAVGTLSLSGSGAIIGDLSNGAVAGSGAGALSVGADYFKDLKSVTKTESLSVVLTEEKRNVKNKDMGGREDINLSYSRTESMAVADVKDKTPYGPCDLFYGPMPIQFELNAVLTAGMSGATSSIGDFSQGAGALGGGLYIAGAIGMDKVKVSGHSTTNTAAWKGANNTAQWAGSYATNTTVAKSNVTQPSVQ